MDHDTTSAVAVLLGLGLLAGIAVHSDVHLVFRHWLARRRIAAANRLRDRVIAAAQRGDLEEASRLINSRWPGERA